MAGLTLNEITIVAGMSAFALLILSAVVIMAWTIGVYKYDAEGREPVDKHTAFRFFQFLLYLITPLILLSAYEVLRISMRMVGISLYRPGEEFLSNSFVFWLVLGIILILSVVVHREIRNNPNRVEEVVRVVLVLISVTCLLLGFAGVPQG